MIGYNVFAYCANNPVMYTDKTGGSITVICIVVFGILGALAARYYDVEEASIWKYVLGGILIGGAAGVLIGWGAGGVATAAAAKSASMALFADRIAANATMVIQLLQKFYENNTNGCPKAKAANYVVSTLRNKDRG